MNMETLKSATPSNPPGGFNVVTGSSQHEHSDQSAAMQPHSQQAAMHSVVCHSWPVLHFSCADPCPPQH